MSDGSTEPCRVVELAAGLKLPYIAITDHDTMSGVNEALMCAKGSNVRVIPGIEVSTYDYLHRKKVHILCYMPKKPEPLLEMCEQTLKNRTETTIKMIEKVSARYPVSVDIVNRYASRSAAIYKQHIMLALMDLGYSPSVFGELYSELFSSKNGWALIDTKLPETRDAMKIIKETGGAAVLAHPGVYANFDIIDELCGLGLDGIEVFHPRVSKEDSNRALEASQHYNLIRTGGSDFHGMCASRVTPLGLKQTEDSELEKLLMRFE
jgi:phosphoribosyl 1,2-cyclic phosphate 1,2-diphosphodiesterase